MNPHRIAASDADTTDDPETGMPRFNVKRVYDAPAADDGRRVLIDRLWPRGLTKGAAALDEWCKDAAPSNDLRKWVHAEPGPSDNARWDEFRRRYHAELDAAPDGWGALLEHARAERVSLLTATKDPDRNHALELLVYLESRAV